MGAILVCIKFRHLSLALVLSPSFHRQRKVKKFLVFVGVRCSISGMGLNATLGSKFGGNRWSRFLLIGGLQCVERECSCTGSWTDLQETIGLYQMVLYNVVECQSEIITNFPSNHFM